MLMMMQMPTVPTHFHSMRRPWLACVIRIILQIIWITFESLMDQKIKFHLMDLSLWRAQFAIAVDRGRCTNEMVEGDGGGGHQ